LTEENEHEHVDDLDTNMSLRLTPGKHRKRNSEAGEWERTQTNMVIGKKINWQQNDTEFLSPKMSERWNKAREKHRVGQPVALIHHYEHSGSFNESYNGAVVMQNMSTSFRLDKA
jgi:hypothetical protein